MNWIDKKYKELLGHRQFDNSLRQKGKKSLEELLAKEMPVTPANTGKGQWFKRGMAVLLVALLTIPAGLWYWQQSDNTGSEQPVMESQPAETITSPEVKQDIDGTISEDQQFHEIERPDPDQHQTPMDNETSLANDGESSVSVENQSEAPLKTEKGMPMKPTKRDGVTQAYNSQSKLADDIVSRAGISSKPVVATDEVVKTSDGPGTVSEEKLSIEDKQKASDENGQGIVEDGDISDNNPEAEEKRVQESIEAIVAEDDQTSDETTSVSGSNEDFKSEVNEAETVPGNKVTANITEVGESGDISEKEETPSLPDNKIAEAALSSEDEEKADEAAEGIDDSESAVQLYNLSFSEFGSEAGAPDISNYKLFSARRFAVSIWGGYTYVGKRISGGSEPYLAIRQEKEDVIWTSPTGMSIDYFITGNWTLSIGAGWSEYGEVLDYGYSFTDSVNNLDGRYKSPYSYGRIVKIDSIRIVDSIYKGHWNYDFTYTSEDTAIKNNNGQTRWSYIEIPVLVGYRFGKGRIKPWVQTGVSFGIPYASSFRYISPSGQGLQSVEDGKGAVASLQYNYLLQLGMDCYLTRRWSVRLNGFGSYQLNPAVKFSGTEQRYYRLGGTIGIGYNF